MIYSPAGTKIGLGVGARDAKTYRQADTLRVRRLIVKN